MRRSSALLDRLVAGLLGMILVAAGLHGIAAHFDVEPFATWSETIQSPEALDDLTGGWFTWVLAISSVVGFVLAIALLAANLDRRQTDTRIDAASDETGELRFHLGDIADAVATHFQAHDGVRRARGRAEIDRGTETITVIIEAEHDADLPALRGLCDDAADDVVAAIGGPDCGVRFHLHLDGPS